MPSFRGSPQPRDGTRVSCISCIGRRALSTKATQEIQQIFLGIPIIKKKITEFVVITFAFNVQSRDSRQMVVTVWFSILFNLHIKANITNKIAKPKINLNLPKNQATAIRITWYWHSCKRKWREENMIVFNDEQNPKQLRVICWGAQWVNMRNQMKLRMDSLSDTK